MDPARTTRSLALLLAAASPLAPQVAPEPLDASSAFRSRPRPLTVAERSGWTRTSTTAEVLAFLDRLADLPHADRLRRLRFGTTTQGRPLVAVVAAAEGERAVALAARLQGEPDRAAPSGALRVLVCAGIHGGEVEGKEVAQILLREIARDDTDSSPWRAILEHAELVFVPVFNPDGNDAIDRRNRPTQNGPDGGVGRRANGAGLDLNRDFVKVRSPEVQGMMDLLRRFDPHVFIDLHTTNGSYHGYHLTWAPSLAVNVDRRLDALGRDLLESVRRHCEGRHGIRTFPYGNFSRRARRPSWVTYDHRPRFGTNYVGLRNRLAVLSEAYSYADFQTRARATRAFVVETLAEAVRRQEAILEACTRADAADDDPGRSFGHATELAPPRRAEVLVGEVEEVEIPGLEGARRRIAKDHYEARVMDVRDAFRATSHLPLPRAWAIPRPERDLVAALRRHGIALLRLERPATVRAEAFTIERVRRGRRYQGTRPVTLQGSLREGEHTLEQGALVVPADQRLWRVAAQLLEAVSEDSLATWGYFDTALEAQHTYPVLRLASLEHLRLRPVPPLP